MRRKSESRMGILFIQNIHSKITPVKIKNFLRKFGKINRTFFFNTKNPEYLPSKKLSANLAGMIEFTKKIEAKRFLTLLKSSEDHFLKEIPFKKAFYLKRSNWSTLVPLF